MAVSTQKTLRNQVMYQVFVRNFSDEGTFAAVQSRLDEIKALGTDIIWFMPIHPIGRQARKGTLGSPYAISDYREVNPEFGSMSDFKSLVGAIHGKGMKCIIDVVYNHTSPDSVLSQKHPEWFYHRSDGSFGNRVGDWTDIIDLDYSNRELGRHRRRLPLRRRAADSARVLAKGARGGRNGTRGLHLAQRVRRTRLHYIYARTRNDRAV